MNSPKRYEKDFDDFYQRKWEHDPSIRSQDLELVGYPYSVSIELPKNGTWLELGVGSGRVVDFNAANLNFAKCVGMDYSLKGLQLLQRTLPIKIDLVAADVRQLPFAFSAFDLITLFGTIQAYKKHKWFTGINSLVRFLKPSGVLGFSVHPWSMLELVRSLQSPQDFKNLTTAKELRTDLEKNGYANRFSIEKHRVYVILQKLLALFGYKFAKWYGFVEFYKNSKTKNWIRIFDRLFPSFSFGHYWIWILKENK